MKLSTKERLMLINQYMILEKLYPEDAESYEQHREALSGGYSLHYDWLVEGISEELSEEECREVLDIMDMFSFLKLSYDRLDDKSDIDEASIVFQGFDGNNETHLMAYTRYFVHKLNRFQDLVDGTADNFNSHVPSLPRYRRMLERWLNLSNRYELTKADIINITRR